MQAASARIPEQQRHHKQGKGASKVVNASENVHAGSDVRRAQADTDLATRDQLAGVVARLTDGLAAGVLVNAAVAVFVDAVARFGAARANRAVLIVAIAAGDY